MQSISVTIFALNPFQDEGLSRRGRGMVLTQFTTNNIVILNQVQDDDIFNGECQ
jgi:hypothetical protein